LQKFKGYSFNFAAVLVHQPLCKAALGSQHSLCLQFATIAQTSLSSVHLTSISTDAYAEPDTSQHLQWNTSFQITCPHLLLYQWVLFSTGTHIQHGSQGFAQSKPV
jgi:hypothetical protein